MTSKEITLKTLLKELPACAVACSGGVDSMLLATLAHEAMGKRCIVVHCISPAVQEDSTARVKQVAAQKGWNLHLVKTKEFEDENYLKNPANRCYFCKHHLYDAMAIIAQELSKELDVVPPILNGTNLDDLGEYRPGLDAAKKFGVRFPFVEAGFTKSEIREMCRQMNLPFADVPGGACLSSRLYTATRVTEDRLKAAYRGEALVREWTGVGVVRCRFKEDQMFIELTSHDQDKFNDSLLNRFQQVMLAEFPWIQSIAKDSKPYAPGRSFLVKEGRS